MAVASVKEARGYQFSAGSAVSKLKGHPHKGLGLGERNARCTDFFNFLYLEIAYYGALFIAKGLPH